jgi:hypothetical protein
MKCLMYSPWKRTFTLAPLAPLTVFSPTTKFVIFKKIWCKEHVFVHKEEKKWIIIFMNTFFLGIVKNLRLIILWLKYNHI